MTLDDRKFENDVSKNDRDVELVLDDALAQYAMAEPRPGLEGRILARLATAREQSRRSLQWWGVFALGTAAAFALALFFGGQQDQRLIPQAPVAKLARPPQLGESTTSAQLSAKVAVQNYSGRTGRRSVRPKNSDADQFVGATQPDTPPKLEQFPAPAPLSDQERMLATYVRDFPKKAALMARAQTEVRKEDEREMAAPWPKNAPEALEQPE